MASSPTDPDNRHARFATWLLATRPKTLLAACAPVIVGAALAYRDDVVHVVAVVCALLSAVFIQIGTNFFNDYADHKKGADTDERLGPLRATQAGLVTPAEMKTAAAVAFAIAVLFGSVLMWRGGLPIIIIGILSVTAGYLYSATRFALAYTGLADVFVLIFFGPVAVGGTYYVQALTVTPEVIVAGFAPGLLSMAILLVNNIRDVDQDRAAHKRTLVVRFGRRFGVLLYVACVTLATLVPLILHVRYGGTLAALAAMLILPLAVPLFRRLSTSLDGALLNNTLAATARLLLLYSVVFAIGWNLGA